MKVYWERVNGEEQWIDGKIIQGDVLCLVTVVWGVLIWNNVDNRF